ncbi:MAG: NAD(P)-dependent oxidoreductase [Proteobacteria bacterium]|nr:NAD(P)-dependent oxidoreductase [Pseudomonadota bacterium]MBS0571648.1 NAD(P)-dependent oxidoreductase [Pseudomonadota bacterium]
MSARLLLTGATGLIGTHAAEALALAGYDVVTVGRSAPAGPHPHLRADLLDAAERRAAVRAAGATHLLHLAWQGEGDRWNGAANLDWAAATIALVREFAEAGGSRAVCVGSCAEYDWAEPLLSETSPLRPRTLYGQAKAATGTLLTGAAPVLGLSLAWARIFFCYGPGEPRGRLLGDLVHGLRQGERVACTDGRQERDFLHTADVGRALAAVLRSALQGAVNIGGGRATPVRQLIETAAGLIGRPDLIDLGARPRPPGDPDRLVADTARLSATGFAPRFDLRSGLADAITRTETAAAPEERA